MNEVEIRLLRKSDYAALYAVIENNRERLITYFPTTCKTVIDFGSAKKFAISKINHAIDKVQFHFVVVLPQTSTIVGMVLLKNIDWTIPKGEIAYFVDKAYEGKGITSYAVGLVVQYAFNQLKMEKLFIKFNPQNLGSKKVAIKNGFEREGLLKCEFRTGHGNLTDVERYGLLKSEWHAPTTLS